jgi:hypothetical protein
MESRERLSAQEKHKIILILQATERGDPPQPTDDPPHPRSEVCPAPCVNN